MPLAILEHIITSILHFKYSLIGNAVKLYLLSIPACFGF